MLEDDFLIFILFHRILYNELFVMRRIFVKYINDVLGHASSNCFHFPRRNSATVNPNQTILFCAGILNILCLAPQTYLKSQYKIMCLNRQNLHVKLDLNVINGCKTVFSKKLVRFIQEKNIFIGYKTHKHKLERGNLDVIQSSC